ncbi:hypothetical protein V8E53_001716 [Lactarius tabidus]
MSQAVLCSCHNIFEIVDRPLLIPPILSDAPLHPLQSLFSVHASPSTSESVYYIMNSTRPGSFQVSARAYVENARPVPGKPRTVVLDVYLFGAPDEEEKEIACSLRYFKTEEAMVISEGLYDVVAIVVTFRPHVNEASSIICENDFKLMGDLTEARLTMFLLIHLLIFWATQLKPIPIPTDDVIKYSKLPGLVVVHGSVTFVDEAHDYFCLKPSQYVSGMSQNEAIPLRALMNRNCPFSPHALKLPKINCLVGFTGRLLSFEPNSDSGAGHGLRAKVSVETISQLSDIGNTTASKKPADVCNVVDDEETVALKERIHKYGNKSGIKADSSKGKRKVTLSLDGLSPGKGERGDKKRK